MSYIFEALQRAENERAGGNLPRKVDTVAELLQGVEQEIARKQAEEARAAESNTVENVVDADAVPMSESAASGKTVQDVAQNFASAAAPGAVHEPMARVSSASAPSARPSAVEPKGLTQNPRSATAGGGTAAAKSPFVTDRPKVTDIPERAEVNKEVNKEVKPKRSEVYPERSEVYQDEKNSFAAAKVLVPALVSDARLVCLTEQGGLAAEKFRVLGLKLRHMRERRQLKRIVVTGTAPQEGKSLVAANLALNQSRSKILKTLLIDGDLRRPTVASRFGFDSSLAGLSECLRGERDLFDVVYKLNGSGLWFLPAGRAPENPLELMQGGRLPELLDQLGAFFDWIVIDTPPVVPVADTAFWMKQADGVLLVIREGFSEKKIVERALDSFDRATLLGVIVNSCSRTEHNNYYSRYGQAAGGSEEGSRSAEFKSDIVNKSKKEIRP